MPKVITILRDAFYAVAVYLATLVGILLSQYAPLLLSHSRLDSTFDFVRLVISMAIAFYIVGTQEAGGDDEGKKKNFRKRIGNAFAHGAAWSTMMGIAGTAAGQ